MGHPLQPVVPWERVLELWRTLPLYGMLAVAVVWHLALIVFEQTRGFYVVYAAIHLPAFYLLWTLALVFATNFPL